MKRPPRDPVKDKLVNERYREMIGEQSKMLAASLLLLILAARYCVSVREMIGEQSKMLAASLLLLILAAR